MTTDLNSATETALELSNTVGATAANLQNSAETVRTLRRLANDAARHPERLAALGIAFIATSAALALKNQRAARPGQ